MIGAWGRNEGGGGKACFDSSERRHEAPKACESSTKSGVRQSIRFRPSFVQRALRRVAQAPKLKIDISARAGRMVLLERYDKHVNSLEEQEQPNAPHDHRCLLSVLEGSRDCRHLVDSRQHVTDVARLK